MSIIKLLQGAFDKLLANGILEGRACCLDTLFRLVVELVPLRVVEKRGSLELGMLSRRAASPVRSHATNNTGCGRSRDIVVRILLRVLPIRDCPLVRITIKGDYKTRWLYKGDGMELASTMTKDPKRVRIVCR